MKLLFIAITLASLWPGPRYLDENCSQFVCRRANRPTLKAQELWDGGRGQLQVVQAQEAVASAHESYIEALYAHNLSKVELAYAIGDAEQGVKRFLKGEH